MASEHRFTVYVAANLIGRPDDPDDERTEADFAESMLWHAHQAHAENMDGWADCTGTAWIADVQYEESR